MNGTLPLWNDGDFVDDGDMELAEREALVCLVRHMFVTSDDACWPQVKTGGGDRLRRDLSNLGLSLVVDARRGVAWAEQVPQGLRGSLSALRRESRPERPHVAHAALCLRQRLDESELRGEPVAYVSVDDVREWLAKGPLGREHDGDAERMDRAAEATCERLQKLGLIKHDRDTGTYRILRTVSVLVSDEWCRKVVASAKRS